MRPFAQLKTALSQGNVGRKRLWLGLGGAAFVLAYLLFSHPDLWETANHSYIFLQSLFSGRLPDFYGVVAAHENPYYYINGANYNILVYLLFGLWELPVYLVNTLFRLPLNESFLIYWAKLLSVGCFVACGWLLRRLCLALGFSTEKAGLAALLFWFDPVAFFSPMVMGQYDTLCLLFTLWGLCLYVQGRLTRFALLFGAGMVCKSFPLLLFVPLVLLAEKRPLRLLGHGLTVLWLYLPTTLLYWGRTGDAVVFSQVMQQRLFALTADTGTIAVSVFCLGYAVVLFGAFLYSPANAQQQNRVALYLCLAVYCWLFGCVTWHPQWLVLLVPFVVVTTLWQPQPRPWFWLDIAFAAGYFLCCFLLFPNQMGAHLLDGGVLHHLFGVQVANQAAWRTADYFLGLFIPYVTVAATALFHGGLLLQLIFKFPTKNGCLAQRLCRTDDARWGRLGLGRWCGVRFALGFGCWLLPTLLEALNAFEVI